MVLAHQLAPGGADLHVGGVGRQAEYLVGVEPALVGRARIGLAVAGALPAGRLQPEAGLHALEEAHLAAGQRAVGTGDLEQRSQHVLQHGAVVGEGLAEPVGKGLELLGRFARLVEQLRHVLHVLGRDAEQALEGVDLGPHDRPVALGELGREHHHRDGEELLLRAEHGGEVGRVGPQPRAQRPGIGRVAHGRAHDRADRPAGGEAREAADDLAPEAQAATLSIQPM